MIACYRCRRSLDHADAAVRVRRGACTVPGEFALCADCAADMAGWLQRPTPSSAASPDPPAAAIEADRRPVRLADAAFLRPPVGSHVGRGS